jgi:hypothetical protein
MLGPVPDQPSKFGGGAAANGQPEQYRLPQPTDLIFPKRQRKLSKTILDEEKLRIDRVADVVLGAQLTA